MKSFIYAFRGICYTIRTERNMRVHLCFAFYVIIAGFVTRISKPEWTAILVCICGVIALECFNTSVERICDTVHPEKSEGIKRAKDTAAAAVLCAAIVSAVIGSVIFLNTEKITEALAFFNNHTVLAIIIVLTLIPLCFFVKGRKREK